jgi:hypothetical protein
MAGLVAALNPKEGNVPDFREEAKEYDATYNSDWESEAHAQRGEFIRRFPVASLGNLTLEKYAIGQSGRETFCYWVEQGTKKWAGIVGATANKFGVYFGATESDKAKRYRYTRKFAGTLPEKGAEVAVFDAVRSALVDLASAGERLDFLAIDLNPLSQMFKAKVLSLYYPDRFLPICSADNLRDLAPAFNLDDGSPSEIQHQTLSLRASSPGARRWSTLKYTAFLYDYILRKGSNYGARGSTNRRTKKSGKDRVVDFEKLTAMWRELGKKSEAYALEQERARLLSLGYESLIHKIKDRTSQPGHGFDFESFERPGEPRYVEVKTFTRLDDENSQFFLSCNEREIALSPEMRDRYYFYLVVYGSDREPVDCLIRNAKQVFGKATLLPQSYLVRLPR